MKEKMIEFLEKLLKESDLNPYIWRAANDLLLDLKYKDPLDQLDAE